MSTSCFKTLSAISVDELFHMILDISYLRECKEVASHATIVRSPHEVVRKRCLAVSESLIPGQKKRTKRTLDNILSAFFSCLAVIAFILRRLDLDIPHGLHFLERTYPVNHLEVPLSHLKATRIYFFFFFFS